jgi:hypothetical protein
VAQPHNQPHHTCACEGWRAYDGGRHPSPAALHPPLPYNVVDAISMLRATPSASPPRCGLPVLSPTTAWFLQDFFLFIQPARTLTAWCLGQREDGRQWGRGRETRHANAFYLSANKFCSCSGVSERGLPSRAEGEVGAQHG